MISIIGVFFLIYTSFLFLILGIGMNLQWKKERSYLNQGNNLKLSDLTVIVPFRNEELRISVLLDSLLIATSLPSKIIFVDDHSTDNSVALIEKKLEGFPFEIKAASTTEIGKKKALRIGIEAIKTNFFLTLDADVAFSPDYFKQLEKLEEADLYLLPAVLISKRWFEPLFEVDLLLVNALNTGLSGLKRPIIASGANLLVRKSAFEQNDQFETHAHIPSGDDIYLLRDFRNANADVRVFTQTEFKVTTETPQSFSEFIHQRIRWVAKTGDVKDHLSTSLALTQLLLTVVFFGLLFYLFFTSNFYFASILFTLKVLVDMLLFLPFFNRFKRLTAWWILPIYQFLFPFYNLLILVLLPFFTPVWKGRKAGVGKESKTE